MTLILGGGDQKSSQNNHIWLVVILWRCFIRQPPVQDNQFWVVPRVAVLYRFDCIKIQASGLSIKQYRHFQRVKLQNTTDNAEINQTILALIDAKH